MELRDKRTFTWFPFAIVSSNFESSDMLFFFLTLFRGFLWLNTETPRAVEGRVMSSDTFSPNTEARNQSAGVLKGEKTPGKE